MNTRRSFIGTILAAVVGISATRKSEAVMVPKAVPIPVAPPKFTSLLKEYVNKNEHESPREVLALENQLLAEFRAMSVGERNSALALNERIWKFTSPTF